jgi:hypothetical protein
MTTIWITLVFTIGISGFAYAQSNKKVPEVKISMIINASIDSAFNYILPVDLTHIFKRYKRFPAIIKTNETEFWNKPGLNRTVFFEDGTTAQESMLSVVPLKSFSYRIEKFTSPLKRLAKQIDGEFLFTKIDNAQTEIVWTYKLIPKNLFTKAIINIALLRDLKGLLTNALTILKNDLECASINNK